MSLLEGIFREGLARALPAYERRAEQLQMAAQVTQALARGHKLVVEAGTGTGKTLAYLLPAAQSGLKIVISTATKTLQEQLADKDVPLVQALGVKARFAFLKGRQNYLCLLRKEHFDRQPTFAVREEAGMYGQLNAWAEETRTGDRAELSDLPEGYAAWREVNSTADTCTGQKCPHYDRCFVFAMRRQAAEADVVIVNHHLFFADLALRSSSGGDAGAAVLPRYDAVVFDEAHAVPEVATTSFGVQLSSFRVAELARDVVRVPAAQQQARDLAGRLIREGSSFFEAAARSRPPSGKFSRDADRWSLPPGSLAPAEGERQELAELFRGLSAALSGSGSDEVELLERRSLTLSADLQLFGASQAVSGRSDLEYDEPRPPDRLVQWAEQRAGHLYLHASPIDVASLFQDHLYERVGPVVFTSATLAVGGSLDYFARRVGLKDARGPLFPLEEAVLPSPFDYESNTAIYLPQRMPDPQDERFADAVAEELRQLLPITGGRAFALFTSLRNMRRVHELLAPELPWQVLLQGERPKAQLLKAFRDKPSVLFASQSFWEGVDVQGDALSLVVIDKLPFASPGEPLVQARIEQLRSEGEDPFSAFQVPEAALALKQGFGRLIRSAKDRGIVALLDPRIAGRSYGRRFLASLPRCRLVRSAEEARGFWTSLAKR
jgi:ATP-dependent DNA helicase DinG